MISYTLSAARCSFVTYGTFLVLLDLTNTSTKMGNNRGLINKVSTVAILPAVSCGGVLKLDPVE